MDHIVLTHPHEYYDNGILDEAIHEYADTFDGAWYAVRNSTGDLEVSPSESFYDGIIDDKNGNGRIETDGLPESGERYVAGGIGQKCLYRTIESLDQIDGLIPELTYVEAAPINREERTLVQYDEQKLHRFGGPRYTDLREIHRLDQIDEPAIHLFESAPFEDDHPIVSLEADTI